MTRAERIGGITDSLNAISLSHMASTLEEIYRSRDFDEMDKLDLLEKIIEPEYRMKLSKQLNGRLTRAHLSGSPELISNCIDSPQREYLPHGIVEGLCDLKFLNDGMNLCILGPSDSGKSYLAKAIGIHACADYRVLYSHAEEFVEELATLKSTDYVRYQKRIRSYTKLDLLILDDFLLHTITEEREIKVLHEIMEKRVEARKRVIVCSQREPSSWGSMILNDEVAANAILKRATKHYTVVIKPRT